MRFKLARVGINKSNRFAPRGEGQKGHSMLKTRPRSSLAARHLKEFLSNNDWLSSFVQLNSY